MINLKKLYEIGFILKGNLNEEKLFESILNAVFNTISFDYGTLFTQNDKKQLQPIYSINDVTVDLASNFEIGKGKGIAGWVSDNENPVIFSQFMNDNPVRKFNSFVSIPLIIDKKLIGVLNLGHKVSGFFTENDNENFILLGNQIAIIIDRFKMGNELLIQKKHIHSTIEKLKTAEKKIILNEKNESIQKINNNIHSEINSPLSIIMGFSELLLQKCNSNSIENEVLIEKLDVILDSSRKINTILHRYNNSDD